METFLIKGFLSFEFALLPALVEQLIRAVESMEAAPLIEDTLAVVPLGAQGVYMLFYENHPVYVGKTDTKHGLRARLLRHARKIQQRHRLDPTHVSFKAVQVLVFTPTDLEAELIAHYRPPWNGSGFGANDPGRERDTTKKDPEGFDAQFPIDIDRPFTLIPEGTYVVREVLKNLRDVVPYTFRYEGEGRNNQQSDFIATHVDIPAGPLTVRQLLQLIIRVLPPGWQATSFVSHLILYKESRIYPHGYLI